MFSHCNVILYGSEDEPVPATFKQHEWISQKWIMSTKNRVQNILFHLIKFKHRKNCSDERNQGSGYLWKGVSDYEVAQWRFGGEGDMFFFFFNLGDIYFVKIHWIVLCGLFCVLYFNVKFYLKIKYIPECEVIFTHW